MPLLRYARRLAALAAIFPLWLLPSCARNPVLGLAGKIEPPRVVDKAPGVYHEPVEVRLAAPAEGLRLRYTLDPDAKLKDRDKWSDYEAPVLVSASATLRAYAFSSEANPSDLMKAAYVLRPSAPAISAAPAASSYVTVTIACASGHDAILYTTDGSDPLLGSLYSGPFDVEEEKIVRAVAIRSAAGWAASEKAMASLTIDASGTALSPPVFSPVPGLVDVSSSVSIASEAGASIRYTLDGSLPTPRSVGIDYISPLSLSADAEIRARAFKWGRKPSESSGSFRIKLVPPLISPPGGSYSGAQLITLSHSDPSASIRYTLDGSEPTASSAQYTSVLEVSSDAVLKAVAFKNGLAYSDPATSIYDLDEKAGLSLVLRLPSGAVSLGGQVSTLDYSALDSMTVTATPPAGGTPSHAWYLNGDLVPGATAASLEVGATGPAGRLEPGSYTLTATATVGGWVYSESIAFGVVP